jgi:hypothetical protein
VYATAHVHDVDCRDLIEDGGTFVDTDAGFEVAPGDTSDIEVANAHAWGSSSLVFSDGAIAATALHIAEYPSAKGMSCYFLNCIPATNSHMKTGKKMTFPVNHLLRDGVRVATKAANYDVLLRRRA